MTVKKIEQFKNWLFERTNRQEVKPADYLNRQARKEIRKQQINNNSNE